jgi:polygalacturonase
MNADGLRVDRPTEDVIIRDPVIREAISGIAIGSDTAGGFRNIRVSGITILSGVRYGIYLKSTHTRGGWTEGIHLSDITMHGVQTPIKIDLNYFPAFSTPRIPPGVENNLPPTLKQIPSYWKTLTRPVSQQEGTPHFRDITFSNVNADAARTAIDVNAAQDAPMERFSLQHVHLQGQHAGRIRHTADWQLMDVLIRAGDQFTEEDMHGTIGIIKLIADQ